MGTAVVAPLSGRPRLGVVVATSAANEDDGAREELGTVLAGLSLPADLVGLCRRVSEAAAVALPVVLRGALPPGLDAGRYRVVSPAPGWPWERGEAVGRATLKRLLGPEGLREAEARGSIALDPALPERPTVEWAVIEDGAEPDLSRAPRQRELFGLLEENGGGMRTARLLSESGAGRGVLRELARRRAVRLVRRPEPPPVYRARGGTGYPGDGVAGPFFREAARVVGRGGAHLWRTPTREAPEVVAAVARAVVEEGEQALILAPERGTVERLVRHLGRALPAGRSVVAYHGGLGRGRAAVYAAARAGRVDVLVGTRTAALLPLARPGAICVVDEPNEAHRAQTGYEGLPVHVRDVALERGRAEGAGVLFLSPVPSLRISAPEARREAGIRELPARPARDWPGVRIVDVRGSGAVLSSVLIEACRRHAGDARGARGARGGRVGVVARRLGYATSVSCNRCGAVRCCPNCDLPLAPHERAKRLLCGRCGHGEAATGACGECGSGRVSPTGYAVERVREELSSALGAPVGLLTAGERDLADAPVVVGTARCVLEEEWDAVLFPDADSFLLGGGIGATERAFRLLYGAAEAAAELLLVQTRLPEHYALQAAVRGDYPAFAAAELPRLRSLGYPPFAHLAAVTLEGPEAVVRRAVESRLRPALEASVEMTSPVPLASPAQLGGRPVWRVLLRSPERSVVARAGTLAARVAAKTRGLAARVEVDPEEV